MTNDFQKKSNPLKEIQGILLGALLVISLAPKNNPEYLSTISPYVSIAIGLSWIIPKLYNWWFRKKDQSDIRKLP